MPRRRWQSLNGAATGIASTALQERWIPRLPPILSESLIAWVSPVSRQCPKTCPNKPDHVARLRHACCLLREHPDVRTALDATELDSILLTSVDIEADLLSSLGFRLSDDGHGQRYAFHRISSDAQCDRRLQRAREEFALRDTA